MTACHPAIVNTDCPNTNCICATTPAPEHSFGWVVVRPQWGIVHDGRIMTREEAERHASTSPALTAACIGWKTK